MPRPRRPLPGTGTDERRQMILLLETAAVLELRAQHASDPRQTAVLRRRAEQRRQEAAGIRTRLAAAGVALGRRQPRG